MRRETQFLKVYANHTMLNQRAAHLVMFKISVCRDLQRPKTQLYLPTAEYPTTTLNGRISTTSSTVKIQLSSSTVRIQLTLFKILNSQDHLFWAWCHPHSSPISCLRVYYDKWWLSYPLCTSVNCTKWLCTWTDTRMVQSPTKLNDKI